MLLHRQLSGLQRHLKKLINIRTCSDSVPDGDTLKTSKNGTPADSKYSVSTMVNQLLDRGLFSTTFPEMAYNTLTRLDTLPKVVYAGFDPTADSLHVGNLLVINALLHFYSAGYTVIVLIGGATAQIGDPSGHWWQRPAIETDILKKNSYALAEQVDWIFTNYVKYFHSGPKQEHLKPVHIINNAQWFEKMDILSFFRQIASEFTMSEMLKKRAVQLRLEGHHSMLLSEFVYQVFQAYDWLMLQQKYNCLLQIGGSDQVGNMHAGYDLVKAKTGQEGCGLVIPLITSNESGEKLGKSADNAIWLSAPKSSPYSLYQYFVQQSDVDAKRYFKMFTFYSRKTASDIVEAHFNKPAEWRLQKKLAESVTKLIHGQIGLDSAVRCSEVLFGENSFDRLVALSEKEMRDVFVNVPTFDLDYSFDLTVLDMCLKIGCFKYAEEGERQIRQGALYVNQTRIQEPKAVLVRGSHILKGGITVVRRSKRHYFLVKWRNYDIDI